MSEHMDISAFPVTSDNYADKYCEPGMTLRDYFAAAAMQSMCSGSGWPDAISRPEIAKRAYAMADAMMAERRKEST